MQYYISFLIRHSHHHIIGKCIIIITTNINTHFLFYHTFLSSRLSLDPFTNVVQRKRSHPTYIDRLLYNVFSYKYEAWRVYVLRLYLRPETRRRRLTFITLLPKYLPRELVVVEMCLPWADR